MTRDKTVTTIALLIIFMGGCTSTVDESAQSPHQVSSEGKEKTIAVQNDPVGKDILGQAFTNRQSDVQVQGQGQVIKILPDDREGSQHQKFILKLDSGQTVLVAHNIDLAPRIGGLKSGDQVEFNGEYEWNDRGGIIHWTHHDPDGDHEDGWLKHEGRTYQ